MKYRPNSSLLFLSRLISPWCLYKSNIEQRMISIYDSSMRTTFCVWSKGSPSLAAMVCSFFFLLIYSHSIQASLLLRPAYTCRTLQRKWDLLRIRSGSTSSISTKRTASDPSLSLYGRKNKYAHHLHRRFCSLDWECICW